MTELPEELVIGGVAKASQTLTAALARAATEGRSTLNLDCSRVRRVDGVGIQLLVACRKAAAARGMTVTVVGCSEELREALTFMGLAERYGVGAR